MKYYDPGQITCHFFLTTTAFPTESLDAMQTEFAKKKKNIAEEFSHQVIIEPFFPLDTFYCMTHFVTALWKDQTLHFFQERQLLQYLINKNNIAKTFTVDL